MRKPLLLLAAVWLVAVGGAALGQARTPTTIGVDEIQPGMRGYGLTVFRGTQPERFEVEVIDILHDFRPDMDLIVVRTDHPILDHATTVAGMSGSPIYLDGRLAGAYAYGWPFGKDPVAGVTPIASMLAEMRRPVRPDSFPGADRVAGVLGRRPRPAKAAPRSRPSAHAPVDLDAPRFAGLPPYVGGGARRGPFDLLEAQAGRLGSRAPSGPRGLERASTPVMLGGLTDGVASLLADRLEPLGLLALQAGGSARRRTGAAAAAAPAARFVDGGALGVQLIRGDISATGIGTVTHVGANRTIAFGHPMLNVGEVGLPTSTARVLHVLASESRSFKLAEALDPLGTLVHDRQPAIVVDQALVAETIPVRLRISGVEGAPRTEWNVEVASQRALTPMLIFMAIANAVEATAADQTDVVFTARSRVEIEGHAPIEVEDVGYTPVGPNDGRALGRLRIFELVELAYGNPFEQTRVRSAQVDIAFRFERDFYEIVDASVASDEVDPGGRVNVHVLLRRQGQPDRVRIVPVDIPQRAAGETIEIKVGAGDDVGIESPIPRSVDDLVGNVLRRYPSTSLAVEVKLPSRGLSFRGHVVRDLPSSALDTLQLQNDTSNSRPFVTYDRQLHDVGSVLAGSARLTLRVREIPRGR